MKRLRVIVCAVFMMLFILQFPVNAQAQTVSAVNRTIKISVDAYAHLISYMKIKVGGKTYSLKDGNRSGVDLPQLIKKGDYFARISSAKSSNTKIAYIVKNYSNNENDVLTYKSKKGKCYIKVTAKVYQAKSYDYEENAKYIGKFTWKIPVNITYAVKSPMLTYYKMQPSKKAFVITLRNGSAKAIYIPKGSYKVKNTEHSKNSLTVKLSKTVKINPGKKAVLTYKIVKGNYKSVDKRYYVLKSTLNWNGKKGTVQFPYFMNNGYDLDSEAGNSVIYQSGEKKKNIFNEYVPEKYVADMWG